MIFSLIFKKQIEIFFKKKTSKKNISNISEILKDTELFSLFIFKILG
jgi:hypothetical protein